MRRRGVRTGTLEALREKIGEEKFFQILRTWVAEHRHGNATTEQFIALSERISGQQLDDFFNVWIYLVSVTVRSHLTSVYRKIGARNRVQAARYYLDQHATPRDDAA